MDGDDDGGNPLAEEGLELPMGRRLDVDGRGRTFVREAGSTDAPVTLLLLHGWFASGGLNWARLFGPLGEHYRVVAPDLRGHGRGMHTRKRFRLADCADDLAALVEQLGCRPVVVVGYSMGGVVAQLLWRRHPETVAGLVLCSTTRAFLPGRRQRYLSTTVMAAGVGTVRISRMGTSGYRALSTVVPRLGRRARPDSMTRWAAAEIRRHDMRQILEAGQATSRFDSSAWIGEVDVPTAVVVTTKDRAIGQDAQRELAASIPGATVHTFAGDHDAFTLVAYAPVLLAACGDVATRLQATVTTETR